MNAKRGFSLRLLLLLSSAAATTATTPAAFVSAQSRKQRRTLFIGDLHDNAGRRSIARRADSNVDDGPFLEGLQRAVLTPAILLQRERCGCNFADPVRDFAVGFRDVEEDNRMRIGISEIGDGSLERFRFRAIV